MVERKSRVRKVVKKKKKKKKVRQQYGKNKEPSTDVSTPKHVCHRAPDGKILPGNTANPGGRPKNRFSLTTILENILKKQKGKSKQTQGDQLMKALLKYAKKGSPKLMAIILDRIDGKVPDRLIHTDTGPLDEIDDDKLDKIIKAGRPDDSE